MRKKILYSLTLIVTTLLFCMYPVNGTEKDDVVSVNVLNHIYYGTLTEEQDENSTFTTIPASDDISFSITGKWSDRQDAFNGKCTISYEDGTIQSVTYKNGLIYKNVMTTYPDGTYQTFATNGGKPCKKICTYSKEGELLDLDWYHHCKSVKELTAAATFLDYAELLSSPYDYVDLPIKVCGKVDAIYEVSADQYLKIRDEQNHLYLFTYSNASIQPFFSTNIENVSIGDSIEIYGFFDRINDYEDNPLSLYEHTLGYQIAFNNFEKLIADSDFLASVQSFSKIVDKDLEKDIPVFNAYYWKTDKTDIDPIHLTFRYDEICKYPYYYKDEDLSITGKVVYENVSASSDRVVLLIKKENSSEIYGASYKTTDYTSLLGNTVSCSGLGDGNCKIPYYNSEVKNMGYALYPNIKVSELESLSN